MTLKCIYAMMTLKVDNQRSPMYLQVVIKASKTDPYRQGVQLYIEATDTELCPVTAVISFMVARAGAMAQVHCLCVKMANI